VHKNKFRNENLWFVFHDNNGINETFTLERPGCRCSPDNTRRVGAVRGVVSENAGEAIGLRDFFLLPESNRTSD